MREESVERGGAVHLRVGVEDLRFDFRFALGLVELRQFVECRLAALADPVNRLLPHFGVGVAARDLQEFGVGARVVHLRKRVEHFLTNLRVAVGGGD